MDLKTLHLYTEAARDGVDVIETPTRFGGILFPPEEVEDIVAIAAMFEDITATVYAGEIQLAIADMMLEIKRAQNNGDDPVEEVKLWLESLI